MLFKKEKNYLNKSCTFYLDRNILRRHFSATDFEMEYVFMRCPDIDRNSFIYSYR